MSKRLHGSYYLDGRTGHAFTTDERDKLNAVGFRLVHDESDHRDRGGAWFAPSEQAKHGNGTDNRPFATFNTTGFRLARDEEDM